MSALSTVLKEQIADVPVVYTWTQPHPIFSSANQSNSYDGLAVVVAPGADKHVAQAIGPAYNALERSDRTMWFAATEIQPAWGMTAASPPGAMSPVRSQTDGADANGTRLAADETHPQTQSGFKSRESLIGGLDALRKDGFKALYLQGPINDTVSGNQAEISGTPDWLHDYGALIAGDSSAEQYAPHVLFYPQNAPGPARTGIVPGTKNVFWLSSPYEGSAIEWWPYYRGYVIIKVPLGQSKLCSCL